MHRQLEAAMANGAMPDPDALADPVSCTTLSDAVDNYANTVNATVQVRMKFDSASFTPTFTATKIVIKGKSKI